MNKTFVYVLPDTFSTEALYLYDEIFVFVKSVGNLQKETISKLQTTPSETSHLDYFRNCQTLFCFTVSLSSSDVLSFYCNILLNFVFCWSMCNLPKLA